MTLETRVRGQDTSYLSWKRTNLQHITAFGHFCEFNGSWISPARIIVSWENCQDLIMLSDIRQSIRQFNSPQPSRCCILTWLLKDESMHRAVFLSRPPACTPGPLYLGANDRIGRENVAKNSSDLSLEIWNLATVQGHKLLAMLLCLSAVWWLPSSANKENGWVLER